MKGSLEEISRRTGLSRSTISKALNNCGFVSSDTKQSVLEAARDLDYEPVQKKRIVSRDGSRWLVAAVIPQTPAYFWGEAARGMKKSAEEHPQMRLVSSLFSQLTQEEDMLYCLDYAADLKPDLLVVTPVVSNQVQKKLSRIAERTPVVCFNETANFDFLFYVGADFYNDGVLLAKAASGQLSDQARILKISGCELPMVSRRDEGFRRELMNLAPSVKWVGTIDSSALSPSVMPAQLAREIHEHFEGKFDAVYTSHGHLPQVLSALDKLKYRDRVIVMGYERSGREASDPRLAAVLEQDVFQQGYQCMEAVWRYLSTGSVPENRKMCIYSRLK